MTADYVAKVDRDRRRLARLLAAHLLKVTDLAARHAVAAVRLGHDPEQAARRVIDGDAALGLPGLASGVAKLLGLAYVAGWRRAGLAAGLPVNHDYFAAFDREAATLALDSRPPYRPDLPTLRERLAAQARAVARRVSDAVAGGIRRAVGAVRGTVRDRAKAVREAFTRGGWVESDAAAAAEVPHKALAEAETAANGAYNDGADAGFRAEAGANLTGWQFVAVLDSATSEWCRPLNGVKVGRDDPWARAHVCPRHYHCRSLLRPIFGPFTPTAGPPWLPAAPGFGNAPLSEPAFA